MNKLEISFGSPLRVIHVHEPPPTGFSLVTIWFERFAITAKGDVMYNLPADHTVKMQVSYVDGAGHPATVDGPVEWFTANEELATIEVDPDDPSIVKVIPVKPGRTQVSARADADLGEGVRELLTVCDIMIVAGEAVAGSIQPVAGAGADAGRDPQASVMSPFPNGTINTILIVLAVMVAMVIVFYVAR